MSIRPRIRPKLSRGPDATDTSRLAMDSLLTEAAALSRSVHSAADSVHDRRAVSPGKQIVIKALHQLGPRTVPQLATAQGVSRQHIQSVINELMGQNLVESGDNPKHKRSHLMHLTDAGRTMAEYLDEGRRRLLDSLDPGIPGPALSAAIRVLRAIRHQLDRPED